MELSLTSYPDYYKNVENFIAKAQRESELEAEMAVIEELAAGGNWVWLLIINKY